MAIYDTMQFVSPDVGTICMGLGASMGQFLLTRGRPGQALRLPNARDPDAPAPLAASRARPPDIAIQAEPHRARHRMAERISFHSGQPLEQIVKAHSERDRWFDAEEAVAYGLLDRVIKRAGELS